MPNIAAAFMDDVNIRGPPTHYETNSSGWYTSTHLQIWLPIQLLYPVLSVRMVIIEVIPKILDLSVRLGTPQQRKLCPPACQEGRRNVLGLEMDICVQRLWLWVIAELMRDVTPRIARSRRL